MLELPENCLSDCFYFILWARLAGRIVQIYEKLSFFSIFSRMGLTPTKILGRSRSGLC